jgi:hypothetical protein
MSYSIELAYYCFIFNNFIIVLIGIGSSEVLEWWESCTGDSTVYTKYTFSKIMLFISYLISYLNSRLVILITIRLSVPRLRWPHQLLKPGGRLWGLSFYTSSSIHLLPLGGATFYFILIPLESFWQTFDIKTYQVDLAIVINTVPPTHKTRICIYSAAEAFYQVRGCQFCMSLDLWWPNGTSQLPYI